MSNPTNPNRRPAQLLLAEWAEPALQPAHRHPNRHERAHLRHVVLPPEALRIEIRDGPLQGPIIWVPVPSGVRPSMLALLASRAAARARRAALQ